MNCIRPTFILVGNGSYNNRGCEAIVRGTTKILRECYKEPQFVSASHFSSEEQFRTQCEKETDHDIIHLDFNRLDRRKLIREIWRPKNWSIFYQYLFDSERLNARAYGKILPYLPDADAVLSVGGDNYSLDYGVPKIYTALDDLVLAHGMPIIIWGSSVGPFSKMPDYERFMGDHLKKVTGIFVRESLTVEYLKSIGVSENLHECSDPAFVMDAVKPTGIDNEMSIEPEAIGINFSPLMARYQNLDIDQWVHKAAAIVKDVAKTTERPIYLIPHVMERDSNDHEFLEKVSLLIDDKSLRVSLVPDKYNAAETKWIISQMSVFAGARTHSTIAALSSCVPTLSFGYSIKARGINQDLFGHTNFCLEPADLEERAVSKKIRSIIDETTAIRQVLRERIPIAQQSSMNAGTELKNILEHKK